jgi:hypothetical protein
MFIFPFWFFPGGLTLPASGGTSEKGEESSGRKASCPCPQSRFIFDDHRVEF